MSAMTRRLKVAICFFTGLFLFSDMVMAQTGALAQTVNVTVQTLDGRNGKPLSNQRLLVFTGLTSDAVKSHAEHTGLMTDKGGVGTLTIYLAETQWIQVWADGRVLCQQHPNQNSFNVATIMSKGLTTPNTCSALVREPTPGHFIIFARPTHLTEKLKQ